MIDIFNKLLDYQKKNIPVSLCTVVDAKESPGKPGFKMLVTASGEIHGTVGGGKLEYLAVQNAVNAINKGQNTFIEYTLEPEENDGIGMYCGGYAKIFIEVYAGYGDLHLFGGGHICRAMGPMAKELGFNISVYDNRAEFADKEYLPFADNLYCGNYCDLIKNIKLGPQSYVAIFTHGHLHDGEVLKAILEKDTMPFYLGMIGSSNKVVKTFADLKDAGVSSEKLEKVLTPIGLFKANTPAEVAISILAQMLSLKLKG